MAESVYRLSNNPDSEGGAEHGQAPNAFRISWKWAVVLVAICLTPALFLMLGFDFSTSALVVQSASGSTEAPGAAAFQQLSGNFTHTLLEWSAVCAAICICVMCLVQYGFYREPSLLVIGVALICSGAMDAFHTLAADRLLPASASNHEWMPFTWTLSRLLNGLILLVGVATFATIRYRTNRTEHSLTWISLICVALIGISFATVHWCASSASLPRTVFPDHVFKRPYDILPLVPYLLCGLVVFPLYYRRYRDPFAFALILSIIPQVATQLYMVFGSGQLHDSCFNIAHALKVVSYAVPGIGLLAVFIKTFRAQQQAESDLRHYTDQLQQTHRALEKQAAELEQQRDQLSQQSVEFEAQTVELQQQKKNLQQASANAAREGWIKSGKSNLSDMLRGEQELTALCRNAVTALAQHLDAHAGVIYLSTDQQELQFEAGYGCDPNQREYRQKILIGQGLVGQVALDKKRMLVEEIPDGYVSARAGLVEILPRNLVMAPIVLKDELLGVIQLASLKQFSDLELEFLEACSETIAFAINSANARWKMSEMLQASQQQSKELQAKNAKLAAMSQELDCQKTEVEQKNRELAIANQEVQSKAAELAKSSAYKSEFLANMSHEIRTPMTAILGFTDVLMGNLSQSENIEAAKTIKRNGEYLLEIINDILDLSKIEAGKLEVERIECSPAQLVSDIASLMRVRARAKNLPLTVEFEGEIPERITSDPTRIRQVIINLVGNSIKFTEAGGVTLKVKLLDRDTSSPRLSIQVIDTGIGMSNEQIDRLFQPFTQADSSTTRKFGGTGLGLTISKRLIEMMGGTIDVTSQLGQGTTFTVTVETGPLDQVKMLANPSAENETQSKSDQPIDHRIELGCRVLLAEDGPDNQRLISFLLKKAGAEVTIAENGLVAYNVASQAAKQGQPFDVILMDMQMPEMDGYTATGKLREDGYPGPIVALTAHAMSSDRQKCLDAGCDDYLTKPVNRTLLIERVAHFAALNQQASSKV